MSSFFDTTSNYAIVTCECSQCLTPEQYREKEIRDAKHHICGWGRPWMPEPECFKCIQEARDRFQQYHSQNDDTSSPSLAIQAPRPQYPIESFLKVLDFVPTDEREEEASSARPSPLASPASSVSTLSSESSDEDSLPPTPPIDEPVVDDSWKSTLQLCSSSLYRHRSRLALISSTHLSTEAPIITNGWPLSPFAKADVTLDLYTEALGRQTSRLLVNSGYYMGLLA